MYRAFRTGCLLLHLGCPTAHVPPIGYRNSGMFLPGHCVWGPIPRAIPEKLLPRRCSSCKLRERAELPVKVTERGHGAGEMFFEHLPRKSPEKATLAGFCFCSAP